VLYQLARNGGHAFVDTANFEVILAVSTKFRGSPEMLERRRSEKKGELLAERAGSDGSLMPLLGLAFWRMRHAFEREVGLSAATWYLLAMLIEEDGISQGEVSHRFEVDPSRITRLAQRLEGESLLRRKRDPEDNRVMRLHATGEGRLLIESLQERREGFEDRVRREFSPEELAEFRRALGVVARLMKD
jgi:MarR family transcriptional regulator, organic hydroperoxide resistance regulator